MRKIIKLALMEKKEILTKPDVLKTLEGLGIKWKEYPHAAALTIDDLRADPKKLDHSPFIKNLIYVEKKKAAFFIVAHENTQVGKNVWKKLGTTKNNVRFADEEVLKDVFKTAKGAVNIFSLANDDKGFVKSVVFDKELEKCEYLSFHPQENTSTIELKKEDVFKFLSTLKIEPKFYDLIDKEGEDKDEKEEGGKDAKEHHEKGKKDQKKEHVDADKGETKLKLTVKKTEDFGEWYSQIITKADMIDYFDISGCYVLKPHSFFIWEKIQGYLDAEFKKKGVTNCYFPMFVKEKHLKAEKDHVEGFAPEVAWVTMSGETKLEERIAIRPTSETIMYPHFAKWIKSHRDLPVLLNQWTNVVRWEFKHPTPFIRTREFLWQEGHTAHATKEESDKMVFGILDIYADTYENFLAIPVIKGIKSENEKFAGALYSSTCETFIPENGRAIQACTSHSLGQNFAKIFDIQFENEAQKMAHVWQTSWGFTTRSVGIVVMTHSDDKGLNLPPKVAPVQVVIIPIFFKEKSAKELIEKTEKLYKLLIEKGIRVKTDVGEDKTAGWKYNHWEMKGVPIRLELGPKDLEAGEVKLVRRFDGEKRQIKEADLAEEISKELDVIHKEMYATAKKKFESNIGLAKDWASFMEKLNKPNIVKTPWCEKTPCELEVKEKSARESKLSASESSMSGAAKTLCLPLDQEPLNDGKCFNCGQEAKKWVIWGRSY